MILRGFTMRENFFLKKKERIISILDLMKLFSGVKKKKKGPDDRL